MHTPYEKQTHTRDGRTFVARFYHDEGHGAPWDEECGHGPVREVSRPWYEKPHKKPGERFLNRDPGDSRRTLYAYNWQEACRLARTDWGFTKCSDAADAVQRAVQADFDRLRGWLEDDWHYCGISVTPKGEEENFSYAVWGIESDCAEYHTEVIDELIEQALADAERRVYPVNEIGV